MSRLSNKIRVYLNREVDFDKDVILRDDRIDDVSSPYIAEWNVAEAQPTEEQLNALESQATTLGNNNVVRQTRKRAYGDICDQLDEIFKDIDAWKARIQAIKDANAKE